MATKRNVTKQDGDKRLINIWTTDATGDHVSSDYQVQVKIGRRWTDVGAKMPAEHPGGRDGIAHAFAVYASASA
jgi:hypothetical protein